MKKILTFLLCFYTSIICAETDIHKRDHQHQATEGLVLDAGSVDPAGELITVNVQGLVCDFCAQAIEKVFMRRDEVSGINVNLAEARIIIATKRSESLDDTTLTKLITDSGYNVEKIIRNSTEAF